VARLKHLRAEGKRGGSGTTIARHPLLSAHRLLTSALRPLTLDFGLWTPRFDHLRQPSHYLRQPRKRNQGSGASHSSSSPTLSIPLSRSLCRSSFPFDHHPQLSAAIRSFRCFWPSAVPAPTDGAECMVEAARMVRITLSKQVYPEPNTRNSFTINAPVQPGSNGTLFAKESSLS